MKDYLNEHWRAVLIHNGLADFDALWKLEAQWFEEPNHRRGGWSGVSRCELVRPDGSTCAVFLKRQENHKARLWNHPVRGAPTFLREFQHIMRYRANGIASLEPVYFAMRKVGKDHRAILITEELTGFVSVEDQVQRWIRRAPRHAPFACVFLLQWLRCCATCMRMASSTTAFSRSMFLPEAMRMAVSMRASSTSRNRAGVQLAHSAHCAIFTR